jgi:predicted RNase H-like nuclease (RuvC/YqgF family)
MDKRMFATRLEDWVQTCTALRSQLDLAMEENQETAHQHEREEATRLLVIRSLQKSVNTLRARVDEYREAQQILQAERDDAVVENFLLQQNLSGMPERYKELYSKNQYLHGKLVAIAEAGAFGGMSEEYRAALQLTKGTALEDLELFKTASG